MRCNKLTKVVHKAILSSECSASVEEIAVELNKRPGTFYNELNPYHEGPAKLGLEDAHEAMKMAGSPDLVSAMALEMGYRLVSLAQVVPDQCDIRDELLDDLPPMTAFHEAIRRGEPMETVNALMAKAIREIEETFVCYRSGSGEAACADIQTQEKAAS